VRLSDNRGWRHRCSIGAAHGGLVCLRGAMEKARSGGRDWVRWVACGVLFFDPRVGWVGLGETGQVVRESLFDGRG
jgi:hypothetical protein